MANDPNCLICSRVSQIKEGRNPFFVSELPNSYLVVGDHQYFKGYCLLIMKEHIEDLTDEPSERQLPFMEDVLKVAKFLKVTFQAKRINYSCLGNFVPHVHYHLFPRYEEDLANEKTRNPWHCVEYFDEAKLSDEKARDLASLIRTKWEQFQKSE